MLAVLIGFTLSKINQMNFGKNTFFTSEILILNSNVKDKGNKLA